MQSLFYFLAILIFIPCTCAASQYVPQQKYGLQDLEVLEAEREYKEFFAHAKDVKPSERNKIWKEMVKSMAMQMLDTYKSFPTVLSEQDYQFFLDISSWPILKNDEFFIKQRDEVFLNHFDKCFQKFAFEPCQQQALKFMKKYPTHAEFGFHLITRIEKNSKHHSQFFHKDTEITYWSFVEDFVKTPIAEFYCHKEPLKKTIEQKLFQITFQDKHFLLDDYLHTDCWKVLKNSFLALLIESRDAYTRQKLYKLLENKLQLNLTDLYLFSILQMLAGIKLSPEENFLYWDRLNKIAKDYKLREKVLTELKKRVPLEGDVFLGATKQQILIAKGLAKYIPEYVDFYATTCLEHLSGEKVTEGGNPATRCHELFKLTNSQSLLPAGKTLQYTKLMNSWK